MSELVQLIEKARSLLSQQQPDAALSALQPYLNHYQDNVLFLQIYGEILLEASDLENAYEVLLKACELDPELTQGSEKFLYLGQIIGGSDGLNLLNVGLNKLQQDLEQSNNGNRKSIVKKLNQGIFAEIEIWMTDLCMEPEAESKCDELIKLSLQLDENNAESWSILASIRISQQLKKELIELVTKSWELFNLKKTGLENLANENNKEEDDEEDVNIEYVELIQPLLTLCKFAIELELFDIGIEIATNIQDVNENCLESYYLEGFANYLIIKKQQNEQVIDSQNVGEIYTELPPVDTNDETIKENLVNARLSFTNGLKLTQFLEDEDEELIQQMKDLANECGGVIKKKEMLELQGGKNEEDNWEDEIESD